MFVVDQPQQGLEDLMSAAKNTEVRSLRVHVECDKEVWLVCMMEREAGWLNGGNCTVCCMF